LTFLEAFVPKKNESIQIVSEKRLVINNQLLAVSCWQLTVGNWLLAEGGKISFHHQSFREGRAFRLNPVALGPTRKIGK
jgi:hypothetical protein